MHVLVDFENQIFACIEANQITLLRDIAWSKKADFLHIYVSY